VLEVAYLDQTGDLPRCYVTALNGLCNDCVESVLPELHPGVSLLGELTPDDPVVRTNLKRIEQVLLRLLRNAAKFTLSGHITLTYDCLPAERLRRFSGTRYRYRAGHSRRPARRGLRAFRETRSLFAGDGTRTAYLPAYRRETGGAVCSSIRSMRPAAA